MIYPTRTYKKYTYVDEGQGEPLILLYGLFGTPKNFGYVVDYFKHSYRVIIPVLPVFELDCTISVNALTDYVHKFIRDLQLGQVYLLGNSLGGHVALVYTLRHPENVSSLILSGSSGLFENGMGDTYPKRSDYGYIKKRVEEIFYNPSIANKDLVDEVFATVNDRIKAFKILLLAKSTIKHNLKKELPKINVDTCLIWGTKDTVTPPAVAEEFNKLIPNSQLYWIEECGHVPMLEEPELFNNILSQFLLTQKEQKVYDVA